MLHQNGMDNVVCRELGLDVPEPDLGEWQTMVGKIWERKREVKIAIVGKYVQLHDAYLSIIESLNHAGYETGVTVNIQWIDSKDVTSESAGLLLRETDGMIIPGGFGERGTEGMIYACRYARENNIPYLGICLGMQIAVIEFSRNVCGLERANSSEFDETSPHRVIDIMPDQSGMVGSGGTMRLGAYPCKITRGTLMHRLYGEDEISERHRHRFEFNNNYREIFAEKGMVICGVSPDGGLVEAVELPEHRFFTGVQFHPEFKSRPNKPHPLFLGLVKEASNTKGESQ
jgi:CTP synthase